MLTSAYILLAATFVADAPTAPSIRLQDVSKHLHKTVTVSFVVRSLNTSSRALLILNSEQQYRDKGNFSVVILRDDTRQFDEANIRNAATMIRRFRNEQITATGKICKMDGRYVLVVRKHRNLRVAENQG
jgi:DNA/RNA endonuclease YhcR with UshA esterase domain